MLVLTNPKHLDGRCFIIYVTENIPVSSRGLTHPSVWSHLLMTGCRFTLLRRKSSAAAREPSGLGSALSWLLLLMSSGSERRWIFAQLRQSSNGLWALRCMQISAFSGRDLNEDTFYVQTEWRFMPFKFRGKTKVSQTNKQANKQNKPQSAADTLQSSAVRLFNGLLVLKTTPKEVRLRVKWEAITS